MSRIEDSMKAWNYAAHTDEEINEHIRKMREEKAKYSAADVKQERERRATLKDDYRPRQIMSDLQREKLYAGQRYTNNRREFLDNTPVVRAERYYAGGSSAGLMAEEGS